MKHFALILFFCSLALAQKGRPLRAVVCTGGGTASAATCSPSPALSALSDLSTTPKTIVLFTPTANSTGALTLAISGLAATAVKKYVGGAAQDPAADDLRASTSYWLEYDGTNFVVKSVLGNGGGAGSSTRVLYEGPIVVRNAPTSGVEIGGPISLATGYSIATYVTNEIASLTLADGAPPAAWPVTIGPFIATGTGTLTLTVGWTNNAASNNMRFEAQRGCVTPGTTAFGAAPTYAAGQAVTTAAAGTTFKLSMSTFPDMTGCSTSDLIYVQFRRKGDDAADTNTDQANVVHAKLVLN